MSFFLSRGTPSPPPTPTGMKGDPPRGYPRWHPPPAFRIRVYVGEHIFCVLHFGPGTPPPTNLLGRGVPVFFFSRVTPSPPHTSWHEGGPPSRVPKGGPPSRFPARVYVGDSIQFIAQKRDLEGVPPPCQLSRTPTPLSFQWEGGPPLWVGLGGRGHKECGETPADQYPVLRSHSECDNHSITG